MRRTRSPRWGVRGCRATVASSMRIRPVCTTPSHGPARARRWSRTSRSAAPGLSGRNRLRAACGRASCQSLRGSSNPRPGCARRRARGDLFVNSWVMFTRSGGGAVDARPPLKSTGMVRSRTRGRGAVPCDRASPLLHGWTSQECEHRCRRSGLGARAASEAVPGRHLCRRPKVSPPRRTVRVRNRLVVGVAVVGIAVIAAGAPAVLGASSELNDSQRLVTLAELNQQAVTLAHSLADERDEVTAYIASGRDEKSGPKSDGPEQPQRPRRPAGRRDPRHGPRRAAPRPLHDPLAAPHRAHRQGLGARGPPGVLRGHRRAARPRRRTGREDPAARRPRPLVRPLPSARRPSRPPPPAGCCSPRCRCPAKWPPDPQIDPFTGLPVQTQDEGPSEDDRNRDELSAAAQQARVRELAALADFDQAAGPSRPRDALDSTVTGPEVNNAEKYLAALTDRPELSDSDLQARPEEGRRGALRPHRPDARRRVRPRHRPHQATWSSCATTTSPRSNCASRSSAAVC